MKPITVIQGGQYGSEAKGMVAGALALRENVTGAVRTGAINAGHTVYYKNVPYKMQQLPVAWVNPTCNLFIGPGAYIHLPTLMSEVEMINAAMPGDVRKRLYIDHRCSFHSAQDEAGAVKAGRHELIGATGKGCAEAILSKISDRGKDNQRTIGQTGAFNEFNLVNVPFLLLDHLRDGGNIQVEGTQGSLLDMHQGPYPYVTSRMTNPANWVAEAGLPVTVPYRVVMVLRTYPIRVAGNSGPLPHETTWPRLIREINTKLANKGLPPRVDMKAVRAYENALFNTASDEFKDHVLNPHKLSPADRERFKVDLSHCYSDAFKVLVPEYQAELMKVMELTTVTKKPRRIAEFNTQAAKDICYQEMPTDIALTFLNYIHPEIWGITDGSSMSMYGGGPEESIYRLERELGQRVRYVSTGPYPENLLEGNR